MAAVSMQGVSKSYGSTAVVKQLDLEVKDGEFMVFVGPSGCGKSTMLRMIAGLEDITSGELFIDGVRANALRPAERGAAMVFQSYALYPHMTVAENMSFALRLAKAEPSGEMRRDTVLAHEPGLAAVARKLVAGVPWLSRTVHSAAVDGSTRTIHAAGPPFSKKPNTDSAHTPLEVAGPNTRT